MQSPFTHGQFFQRQKCMGAGPATRATTCVFHTHSLTILNIFPGSFFQSNPLCHICSSAQIESEEGRLVADGSKDQRGQKGMWLLITQRWSRNPSGFRVHRCWGQVGLFSGHFPAITQLLREEPGSTLYNKFNR